MIFTFFLLLLFVFIIKKFFKWTFLTVSLCPYWDTLRFRCTGLLTAVHKDYLRVLDYRELLFNDFGDRVAQLLHVQLNVPLWQHQKANFAREILIVNTHLLFPHDSSLCIVRLRQVLDLSLRPLNWMVLIHSLVLGSHIKSLSKLRVSNFFKQVYKILQYVESYQRENQLNPIPIMLCG